ncbi:hypothetical protein HNQ02_003758 [Flavobacterium sp. 7E]|uniref:hypothetical protein n=1 Tax=Flavobacterium sp. 7E TaxID=2735898 RepID=UPI0015711AE0|nr:hypothetical protein [Flavobacterium sp. 7E]NRS90811.1 hypothetical protein [Flavobacterium sp. 7E]
MNNLESIDIEPFPIIENVFEIYSKMEKYIFLPLATINFKNHKVLNNKSFHFISIWDNGSYEDVYFNDFRKEIRIIKFKMVDNKYLYPINPKFPSIQFLNDAYNIIEQNFNENIDYYLTPKNYSKFTHEDKTLYNGAELIRNSINEFDRFDSAYYFERITQYLYAKRKFELFEKINPSFTYSETFIGLLTTRENVISEFHDEGKTKTEIINNLLDEPQWIQNPEEILKNLNLTFIGSISENNFTNGSAEIYLFWDRIKNEVYQFIQWT